MQTIISSADCFRHQWLIITDDIQIFLRGEVLVILRLQTPVTNWVDDLKFLFVKDVRVLPRTLNPPKFVVPAAQYFSASDTSIDHFIFQASEQGQVDANSHIIDA